MSPPADDLELQALGKILEDESFWLSVEDGECEEAGFAFVVVDVHKGEPRRWTRGVTVTVRSSTGRYRQYGYDQALTEMQDSTDPGTPYEVQRTEREVTRVEVYYERVKR